MSKLDFIKKLFTFLNKNNDISCKQLNTKNTNNLFIKCEKNNKQAFIVIPYNRISFLINKYGDDIAFITIYDYVLDYFKKNTVNKDTYKQLILNN